MNILKFINSRSIIAISLSVILSFAFVALATNAATTISTNINTGGTLTVTGVSTLIGAVTATGDISTNGGDISIGTGSATTTLTSSSGYLGIASTTPWGGLSIEAETLTGDAPIFVIGDQGTATPMFYVSGNDGRIGIGTSSPSTGALSVLGDTYISSGLGVGQIETTDGRLTVKTDAGIGTTSASAVGLSVVGDGYFSSGLGAGTVVTTDGRIIADTDFAVASTSLWGQVSIEAGDLTGDAPIFVIGDQGTATPMFYVSGNDGSVGIGTTSPEDTTSVFAVDASSGTTTITNGSGANPSCFQLYAADADGTAIKLFVESDGTVVGQTGLCTDS
jgi:hypothetical protein